MTWQCETRPADGDDSDDNLQPVDMDSSDGEDNSEDISFPSTSSDYSPDRSDQDAYVEGVKADEKILANDQLKERTYQAALLEMAIEQNVIVCLPTGSGKTFIAVQLVKHFLQEEKQDRIVVFLACSVPLVHQQANYLRENVSPNFSKSDELVMELTGDLNIDQYSKDSKEKPRWEGWMAKHKIFVMTAQIFLDCLNSSNIIWSNVSLAIFDECHNAVGDHCMVGIMKHYAERKEENYKALPRILGLTATIINGGNAKACRTDIRKNIKDIESRFDAKAVTYHKYEDVLEHSTNAMTKYIYFSKDQKYSWDVEELASALLRIQDFFKGLDKSQFDERESKIKDIEHQSLKHAGQVYSTNAKSVPQKLCSVITDVVNVLRDLGPYCARIACQMKRNFLLGEMEMGDDKTIKKLYEMVDTALYALLYDLDELMNSQTDDRQVLIFVSDKLLQLCLLLENSRHTLSEPLCGIVFSQQRLTVQVLSWYFQDRASTCPASNFIKSHFVVGSSGVGTDAEEARVTSAKQAKVIEKFHKKEFNLLFATKVLEEGINVPSCNVVIRFDFIQAYPSYVQSMGRARQRDASFYIFLENSEATKNRSKLDRYSAFNQMLAEYLREHALHADEDEADVNDSGLMDMDLSKRIPNYRPGGQADSPQVTATNAIGLVHRYCATLSCDRLVILAPVSWWKQTDFLFRAYVMLPRNANHREIIVGNAMDSKFLAKRSAFMETCKILHQKGGLDDRFMPIPRRIPPSIVDYLDKIDAECKADGRAGKAGTNQKRKWYPKKVPEILSGSFICSGVKCNVYAIVIKQINIDEKHKEEAQLYNFDQRKFLFAIATVVDLAKVKGFKMFARSGSFLVNLKQITLHNHTSTFTLLELDQIRECQNRVFALAGLDFSSKFFQKVETPVLVLPIKKDIAFAQSGYALDWDFVTTLKNYDDNVLQKPTDGERKSKPIYAQNYHDAIVVPWHGNADPKAKYCVVEILSNLTPYSMFEEDPKKFRNYAEYYYQKYGIKPHWDSQPLIKCKQIRSQLNFLNTKYDLSKEKNQIGKMLPRYIPEFCNISPIPCSYYLQAKFLPSIFHRISRLLLANEIKESVSHRFGWRAALKDEGDEENFDTRTEIARDAGPNSNSTIENLSVTLCHATLESSLNGLSSLQNTIETRATLHSQDTSNSISDVDKFHIEYEHPMTIPMDSIIQFAQEKKKRKTKPKFGSSFDGHAPPLCKQILTGIELIDPAKLIFKSLDKQTDFSAESGPSTYTIMEALTLSKANDNVSLERLEVIGDSVLKLFVSQFIYIMYPEWQEGQMTSLRNRLVSNAHLYHFAKKNSLGEILSGSIFRPKEASLQPGFAIDSKIAKVASRLNLPCAMFDQLSLEDVTKMEEDTLLEWAKKTYPNVTDSSLNTCYTHSEFGDKSVADSVEALIGAYYMNGGLDSAARFMEWIGLCGPGPNGDLVPYGRPMPPELDYPDTLQRLILTTLVSDLEELLKYKFKNQWLLVEAFTHPGYKGNRTTGGYQRLEFLGDAILDFLVTDHIYAVVSTPGQLTDLKSALVNNVTFGSLSVRYGLQTYLLSSAKVLQDSIEQFVQYQGENGHQVKGHFKLLNDMECILAEDVEVPKILGDLFESLAGAIYIDSGLSLDTVWRVFYRLMKNEIDIFSKNIPLSPIRELYEKFPNQIKFIDPSESVSEKVTNEMGWTIMRVKVPTIERNVFGCGTNKKNAKTAAAKCALKKLNLLKRENQLQEVMVLQ